MLSLILDAGITTSSCMADDALRIRVSMSAIGSVIDIRSPTRLRDPGDLAVVGHLPETQAAQTEPPVDRTGPPASLASRVGAHLELGLAIRLLAQSLLSHYSPTSQNHLLSKGETEGSEKCSAALVVVCGGDDGDVHPPRCVHVVIVDLRENKLLGYAEAVVTLAVEGPGVEAAEVADSREHDRQQPVEEVPHVITPQGDGGSDRHPLTDLEGRDRFPGPAHNRLLPGDGRQVLECTLQDLGVARRIPGAHVDHNLLGKRHLHDVLQPQLVLEALAQLGAVALLEPRFVLTRRCSGHVYSSVPHFLQTRALPPVASSIRYPARVGPSVGQIRATLEMSIAASLWEI